MPTTAGARTEKHRWRRTRGRGRRLAARTTNLRFLLPHLLDEFPDSDAVNAALETVLRQRRRARERRRAAGAARLEGGA